MKLKLGARHSKLSLSQAHMVREALQAAEPGVTVEIVEISTSGDRKQDTPAADRGDKRDWILELEMAVLDGSVDLAVHSGKDIPAEFSDATALLPVLKRADPRDMFIGKMDPASGTRLKFREIPKDAALGCSSLRRRAQLLRLREDLRFLEHRGNVTTRLDKLDRSTEIYGIILACAGLARLGLSDLKGEELGAGQILPAMNQGILAAQYRRDRRDMAELINRLVDPETKACFDAERACVTILNADCHSSVGIFAQSRGSQLRLTARVLSLDGKECVEASEADRLENASALGRLVGTELLDRGAARLILQASRHKAGFAREGA